MRMVDAAEASGALRARRHDRRADQRQHRRRPGHRRASSAATAASSCAPTRSASEKIDVLRAYGAEVVVCPTAVDPQHPRLLLLGVRPPGPRDARRPGSPTSTPTRTTRSRTYETTGPEIWDADRRPDHPLRRRHRHRRHDHRRRPLPQGGHRRARADRRRRPRGLGLLRRHRPALPRRGRRRGLLARRPTTATSSTRSSRCPTRDSFAHDPAARPRGGPAGRRLLRHGGRRRARVGREARRPTTSSSCCCPTAGAATCRRSSTTSGWPTTGSSTSTRPSRRSATCCDAQGRRRCPSLVHVHPDETVRDGHRHPARVRRRRRCPSCGPSRR